MWSCVLCERTHRQTYRHVHRNTSHPYRGEVITKIIFEIAGAVIPANIRAVRVAAEPEVLMTAQSQKMIDNVYQQRTVTKQSKQGAATRTNESPLLAYSATAGSNEKSVSPSSGRLRTSPRTEVTLRIQ